jgi:hypothetical protein
MATRVKNRPSSSHRQAGKPLSHKQITALAAKEYHVPFWLLWGIAGAESTWGKGGTNLFGLLAAAEGADISNWRSASRQSAKTLAGLKKQYGSWAAAVEHYSGNSYTIAHPRELAAQQGVGTRTTTGKVLADIKTPLGTIPFPGPELDFTNPLGPLSPIDPRELGVPGELGKGLGGGGVGELFSFPGQIVESAQQFTKIATLLTDPKFWIRVAEAVGGMILVYMALKSLTGTSVSDLPGGRIATQAAKAAAFKRLPPAQRVK